MVGFVFKDSASTIARSSGKVDVSFGLFGVEGGASMPKQGVPDVQLLDLLSVP